MLRAHRGQWSSSPINRSSSSRSPGPGTIGSRLGWNLGLQPFRPRIVLGGAAKVCCSSCGKILPPGNPSNNGGRNGRLSRRSALIASLDFPIRPMHSTPGSRPTVRISPVGLCAAHSRTCTAKRQTLSTEDLPNFTLRRVQYRSQSDRTNTLLLSLPKKVCDRPLAVGPPRARGTLGGGADAGSGF